MTSKNILVTILFVVVFATGFMIGRFTDSPSALTQKESTSNTTETNTSATTDTDGTTATQNTEAIDVGSQMTADQRKMLESFGLNPDEITITPSMIACAEAKVGPARIQEIINGATPSFLEGASLVTCYGQ